ncbi:MAG TPA: ATP-binding protein, partial [Candidatus Mediterraneibacter vanvlietii]|nr:ATP-binding protein [Candidatus Mediterraneibacter vanvlietii]
TSRYICYAVADHGKGIPDEEKPFIFDRFYQSSRARDQKEHFGLGLSIARELAKLHKGELTVQDTPGGGCTFLLTLPVSRIQTPGGR